MPRLTNLPKDTEVKLTDKVVVIDPAGTKNANINQLRTLFRTDVAGAVDSHIPMVLDGKQVNSPLVMQNFVSYQFNPRNNNQESYNVYASAANTLQLGINVYTLITSKEAVRDNAFLNITNPDGYSEFARIDYLDPTNRQIVLREDLIDYTEFSSDNLGTSILFYDGDLTFDGASLQGVGFGNDSGEVSEWAEGDFSGTIPLARIPALDSSKIPNIQFGDQHVFSNIAARNLGNDSDDNPIVWHPGDRAIVGSDIYLFTSAESITGRTEEGDWTLLNVVLQFQGDGTDSNTGTGAISTWAEGSNTTRIPTSKLAEYLPSSNPNEVGGLVDTTRDSSLRQSYDASSETYSYTWQNAVWQPSTFSYDGENVSTIEYEVSGIPPTYVTYDNFTPSDDPNDDDDLIIGRWIFAGNNEDGTNSPVGYAAIHAEIKGTESGNEEGSLYIDAVVEGAEGTELASFHKATSRIKSALRVYNGSDSDDNLTEQTNGLSVDSGNFILSDGGINVRGALNAGQANISNLFNVTRATDTENANVEIFTSLTLSNLGGTGSALSIDTNGAVTRTAAGAFDATADHDFTGTIGFTPASGKSFPSITGTDPLVSFASNETATDGNEVGRINFVGQNDASTPENYTYGYIYASANDVSDGSENGAIDIGVGSGTEPSDTVIKLSSGPSNISFHLGAAQTHSFSDGSYTVNNSGETNPGVIRIQNSDTSPEDGEAVGDLIFSVAGGSNPDAGKIRGIIDSYTDGSEEGSISFQVLDSGTENTEVFRMYGNKVESSVPVELPSYTTANLPTLAAGDAGALAFDTTDGTTKNWDGDSWETLGGGGGGGVTYTAGNGIDIASNSISVDLYQESNDTDHSGLEFAGDDSDKLRVKVNGNETLSIGADGLSIKLDNNFTGSDAWTGDHLFNNNVTLGSSSADDLIINAATSINGDNPTLDIKDTSTAAAFSEIGRINFVGNNDNSTPEEITYGFIRCYPSSVIDGDETGTMIIATRDGSDSNATRILMGGSSSSLNVYNNDSLSHSFSEGQYTIYADSESAPALLSLTGGDSTPENGETIGEVRFNSGSIGDPVIARIIGIIDDVTDDSEDGSISFRVADNGVSPAEKLRIYSNKVEAKVPIEPGSYTTANLPTLASGDSGAIVWDSTVNAHKKWDGDSWESLIPSEFSVDQSIKKGNPKLTFESTQNAASGNSLGILEFRGLTLDSDDADSDENIETFAQILLRTDNFGPSNGPNKFSSRLDFNLATENEANLQTLLSIDDVAATFTVPVELDSIADGADTDSVVVVDSAGILKKLSSFPFDATTDRDFTGDITFTPGTGKSYPKLIGTDPTISFESTETAADDNIVGRIDFIGKNDASTPEDITYGFITCEAEDITDGSEDGRIMIGAREGGSSSSAAIDIGGSNGGSVNIIVDGSSRYNFSDGSFTTSSPSGPSFNMRNSETLPSDGDTTGDFRFQFSAGIAGYKNYGISGSIDDATSGSEDTSLSIRVVDAGTENTEKLRIRSGNTYSANPIRLGGDTTSNEFDDYEEGTWDGGSYTKIGNTVHLFVSTAGANSLPFARNAGENVSDTFSFTANTTVTYQTTE